MYTVDMYDVIITITTITMGNVELTQQLLSVSQMNSSITARILQLYYNLTGIDSMYLFMV